ncbi:hypothetical protein [Leptothoe spongobia]|uniref:Uncharacterized protein n=1 Tax=Leptothoe spongobia TAU-MAC 1115 TaxID=1967444 RepID=A0A947DEX9_9CYAN|nr:hypothetical protein [Leptothoe spongobia]MBT9315797.1 hypothetical protein [Leptothoe spongobia TAU-MAC 1115]
MLNQLKTLLSDAQLHQQIKAANTLEDAISLLKATGTEKGLLFPNNELDQLIDNQLKPIDLSEAKLISAAGGFDGNKPRVTDKCY